MCKKALEEKEKLVAGPDCGLTPEQTVGCKVTLTLNMLTQIVP
jgi:hypothetical protein